MTDEPDQEGDTATGPNGETARFDGKNWIVLPAPGISQASDISKSGISGLEHGAAQLVGTPGSAVDLGAWGIGKVADSILGYPNDISGSAEAIRGAVAPHTAQAWQEWGEKNVPGMDYKSKTPMGKGTYKVGEWAPAVGVSAIGGGLPALARGAAGALGSEAAGELAHGFVPKAEPAARMIGLLAGARGASKLGGSSAAAGAAREPGALESALSNAAAGAAGYGVAKFGLHAGDTPALLAALYGMQEGKLIPGVTKRAVRGLTGVVRDEFRENPWGSSTLAGSQAIPPLDALVARKKETK
jgi:hypothetical protein